MATGITFDKLAAWNKLLREGKQQPGSSFQEKAVIGVATDIQRLWRGNPSFPAVANVAAADFVMKDFVSKLLSGGMMKAAMTFLVGRQYFDERSHFVDRVFAALNEHSLNAIPGASSTGKSHIAALWHVADYLIDPENTHIMCASTSENHLKTNLFASINNCFKNMVLDYKWHFASFFVGLDPNNPNGAITGVTYPQDSQEIAAFKGCHPMPRQTTHPKFGNRTRIRIILDEASNMPDGVGKGLSSFMMSVKNDNQVKITMCFNPFDDGHWTAKACAPEKGIFTLDPETAYDWVSHEGWKVTRLDGKKFENVVNKRNDIEGMMTHEAYRKMIMLGENRPECWTYARGFWPPRSSFGAVVQRYQLDNRKFQPLFVDSVTNCGSCDTAVLGDEIVFASARWGRCMGLLHADGRRELFDSNNPHPLRRKPKNILWFEQLLEIIPEKKETFAVAEAIYDACIPLQVKAEWLAVDITGNGLGIGDWLRNNFGQICGINWGWKATEKRMLDDSEEKPIDLYAGITSEMWYCFRLWLEADLIFFAPSFVEEPLFSELTKRRVPMKNRNAAGKITVETKGEYKAREGKSPNWADAAIQMVQLIRMQAEDTPGMGGRAEAAPALEFKTVHQRDTLDGITTKPKVNKSDMFAKWMQRNLEKY